MNQLVTWILSTAHFAPTGECLAWEPEVLSWTVLAHLISAGAYIAISMQLWMLRRILLGGIPSWVLTAFSLCLMFAGTGHILLIVTLFTPFYILAGGVNLVTGVFLAGVALVLARIIRAISKDPHRYQG